jgi:hypothetical protein
MANEDLVIDVIVNGKKARVELDNVEKKTKKVGEQTKKTDDKIAASAKSIKASWVAVGASLAAIGVLVNKATKASVIQLKAETALTAALKANATQGQDNINMWREFASALQDNTLFGDEVILQQAAMLKSMGLTDEQMKSVIRAAIDLSAATGMDLNSSVKNLAKTYSGLAGELGESIPALRNLTKEQLIAGEGVAIVAKQFEGQAQAIKNTDYGEIESAIMSLGDSLERLGDMFLDIGDEAGIAEVLNTIADFGSSIAENYFLAKKAVFEFDVALAEFLGLDERAKILKEELTEVTEEVNRLQNKTEEDTSATMLDNIAISAFDAKTALEQLNKDGWDLTYPLQQMQKEAEAVEANEERKRKAYEETQKNVKQVTDKIADSIVEAAFTGKASFADMATAMIKEMIRVYMQKFLLQAAMSIVPGGGFLASLFHTGGEVKHTGGTIGGNLPTYHSGMRSDERAAKLQVGEAVINRAGARNNAALIDEINKGAPVNTGGGNVTTAEINFNVQAIDAASFNSYLVNNKGTIEGIINNSLRTNGSVRKTIKQVG